MLKDISFDKAISLALKSSLNIILTKQNFIYLTLNEILAEDIIATRNSPVFTNSAMDGFAFKHSNHKKLKIVGEIFAGDKNINIKVNEDECVKIMTGAKVPENLDTVIPIEKCLKVTDEYIEIPEIQKGANVRIKAEEYKKGDILIKKGTIITPEIIAALVSQGIVNVKIYKKPTIAIISSGNELKEPWESANEEEIYNINSHAIKMLLKKHGFEADILGIIPDNLQESIEFIKNLDYDVIISTAGISFGEKDFIFQAFKENGLKEIFYGIRLKPGHPTMFGKMKKSYVFALPGNPLSSYLNALVIVIPFLKKLSGANNYQHQTIISKNKTSFKLNPKKTHFVLGTYSNGYFKAYKDYKYGSAMVSALFNSNALAIVKEGKNEIKKDEELEIILI